MEGYTKEVRWTYRLQRGATLETCTYFCRVLVVIACNLGDEMSVRYAETECRAHLLVEHTVTLVDVRNVPGVLIGSLPRELALLVNTERL